MKQNGFMIQGAALGIKPAVKKPVYQAPKPVQKKKQPAVVVKKVEQPKRDIEPTLIRTLIKEAPKQYATEESEPDVQIQLQQGSINNQEIVKHLIDEIGEVCVRYSHYKDKFKITNGQLHKKVVDEQYCLGFVFKGNYLLQLRDETKEIMNDHSNVWTNLEDGRTYFVEVIEDPIQAEIDKQNYKPLVLTSNEPKQNKRVDDLTQQLKGLSIDEIKDKTAKYKELLEQRDLEDILYK